jgi:hypothetical protein
MRKEKRKKKRKKNCRGKTIIALSRLLTRSHQAIILCVFYLIYGGVGPLVSRFADLDVPHGFTHRSALETPTTPTSHQNQAFFGTGIVHLTIVRFSYWVAPDADPDAGSKHYGQSPLRRFD